MTMNKEVNNVLKTWQSSLSRYGKLDEWNLSNHISILSNYVRSTEDCQKVRRQVKAIRDFALCPSLKSESILSGIKKIRELMAIASDDSLCMATIANGQRVKIDGQQIRFKGQTSKLFRTRLKFKDGMLLRNFDIETECAKDSRIVRRIVEKRMFQAYHKMHKNELHRETNNDRYWSKRATSFQLYNIGQVEHVRFQSRGMSTHWKRMFDSQTGETVFKKKTAYKNKEDAMRAIANWEKLHPHETRKMRAYKCAYCKYWHIGHESEFEDYQEKMPYESFSQNYA